MTEYHLLMYFCVKSRISYADVVINDVIINLLLCRLDYWIAMAMYLHLTMMVDS